MARKSRAVSGKTILYFQQEWKKRIINARDALLDQLRFDEPTQRLQTIQTEKQKLMSLLDEEKQEILAAIPNKPSSRIVKQLDRCCAELRRTIHNNLPRLR